jgi:Ca-activated chloride channel family protein
VVQRRRPKYAVRFTNLDLLANVVDRSPGWRRHLPPALYVLSIAALALALARPQLDVKVPKEEATVILVTDISGSMNAEDVEPTRLAAAQSAAEVLLEELPPKFRVGLIAFSSGVRTVTSPTTDRDEVRRGLYSLQAVGGTAMGDALMHALDTIELTRLGDALTGPPAGAGTPTATPTPIVVEDGKAPAIIILLSDGAQTIGQATPGQAARAAADEGIPIFTIALGTRNGVVDVPDQNGVMRRLRVPPDEDTLQEISDETGAEFFSAPSADELQSVFDDLGSIIGYDTEQRDITSVFAALGGVFVLAAGGLSLLWFNRFP